MIAAARDCRAILLQYAPITERVVAALPKLGIVSRIGAGLRHRRHGGLREAWRLGREFAGLRSRRSRDARARAHAGVDPQHRRVPPRHPFRQVALPVVGNAAARERHDARHRGPRPHRQALRAHRAQRVPPGDRLRPLPHRRRLSGLRRARQPDRRLRAQRRRLAARAAHRRDARDDRRGGAGRDEARRISRQHGARRGRRRRRGHSRRSSAARSRAWRSTCCPVEPVPPGSRLIDHPRVILSPHAAFYSIEAERELRHKAARNIVTWLESGRPDYVVSAGSRRP